MAAARQLWPRCQFSTTPGEARRAGEAFLAVRPLAHSWESCTAKAADLHWQVSRIGATFFVSSLTCRASQTHLIAQEFGHACQRPRM
jgi:hypothetical protein